MPTPPELAASPAAASGVNRPATRAAVRRHVRPGARPSVLDTAGLVPLAELSSMGPDTRHGVRGVLVAPGDALDALLPDLDHLDVIAMDFPAFTDGRGCSHARRLRASPGWTGELRAVGDVRPDLARSLLACGFDVLEFGVDVDPALLERALGRYPGTYQPSYARTGPAADAWPDAGAGRAARGA